MSGKDTRREAAERLLCLLGELPDYLLEEAARTEGREDFEKLALAEEGRNEGERRPDRADGRIKERPRPRRMARQEWKRYGACVACLCLFLFGAALWRRPAEDAGGSPPATTAGMQEGDRAESGNAALGEGGAAAPGEGGGSGAPGSENEAEGESGMPGGGQTAADGQISGAADGDPAGSADKDGADEAGIKEGGGFWYAGLCYLWVGEPALSALPEGMKPVGVLVPAGTADRGDWTAWDAALAGCRVYAAAGEAGDGSFEAGVLYVEQEDGYYRYRPKPE